MASLSLRRTTQSRAIAAPAVAPARSAAAARARPDAATARAHSVRVLFASFSDARRLRLSMLRGERRARGKRNRGPAMPAAAPTTINRNAVSPV